MHKFSAIVSSTCISLVASCGAGREPTTGVLDARPIIIDETTVTANPTMRLCRMPDENSNAFRKLDSQPEIKAALESFAITGGEHVTQLPAPVKELYFQDALGTTVDTAVASGDALAIYSTWHDLGESGQYRSVQIKIPFGSPIKGAFDVHFDFHQVRTNSVPHNLLTDKVEVIRFSIGTDYVIYNLVVSSNRCEQDAYQGDQPGTAYGEGNYAGDERRPYPVSQSFTPVAGFSVGATIEGRTSLGGFDKTMTMEIATFTVTGLGPTPFEVIGPAGTVHAPSHHNFSEEFLADTKDSDLTSEQKALLAQQNIRYFLIRPITDAERNELGLDSAYQTSAIEGLSSDRRTRTRLGVMKQRTNWN